MIFMTIICNHFAICHDFQSSPWKWKCNNRYLIQFWLHCRKWPLTWADTVQMTDTHSPFLTWGIIIIITGRVSVTIFHCCLLSSVSWSWHQHQPDITIRPRVTDLAWTGRVQIIVWVILVTCVTRHVTSASSPGKQEHPACKYVVS